MPEEIKLTSEPLNKAAIRDIEKLASAYERIAKAQKNLGTSGFTPAKGRTQELHDERMTAARARTNEVRARVSRARAQTRIVKQREEQAKLRTSALADRIGTAGERKSARELGDAKKFQDSFFRNFNATDTRRAEYRNVEKQFEKDLNEAFGLNKRGGGGGGGGGGRGGGGRGGGRDGGGRGPFSLRDRFRIPGTGIIGNVTGGEAAAAGGIYAFITAITDAVRSVDELHKASLAAGGSMQEAARLQTLGVKAAEANSLRERLHTDPFAIMTMGYMPDPRLGGPQNNLKLQQRAIDLLRTMRNNPDQQLITANRLGLGGNELRAANLSDNVYKETQETARYAPNRKQAEEIADTQGHLANLWDRIQYGFARLVPKMFTPRSPGNLIGDIREAFSPNPKEKESPIDANTRAMQELTGAMKQNQRDFFGRGVQDRGAMPNALWGVDLMHGIRSGAIRQGAFR